MVALLPGGLAPLLGSIAMVLAGLGVRLIRDIKPVQRIFSWYMITFGIATGASRLVFESYAGNFAAWTVVGLGALVGSVTLLRTAWLQARPLKRPQILAVAIPAVLLFVGAYMAAFIFRDGLQSTAEQFYTPYTPGFAFGWLMFYGFVVVTYTASALLATRAATAPEDEVGQVAVLSNAIVLYPSIFIVGFIFYRLPFSNVVGTVVLLGTVWMTVVWLKATETSLQPRSTMLAALVPAAMTLVGIILGALVRTSSSPVPGVTRFLMVAVLAYAVIRHHALEIDIRLRWGISKSATAGIILAAIFVASEGAQSWFGEDRQWVGLVAGALVIFAISPLQRFADRIASAAVPGPVAARKNAAEVYLAAYKAAERGGSVTLREERHLARVADMLGLSSVEALELRQKERSNSW